jgi:hypothetical protein
MTKRLQTITVVALVLLLAASAQAVLFRVGPNDVPSPPGTGFPFWYQDTNGLALDLCLPANQAELNAGVCLILPPDQDPAAGISLPIVFPTNFPDEAFWWNATTVMDVPGGGRATLVLALEAAFATGPVVPGDQVSFGRVRIVMDAPVAGTYTVTHPFGVEPFPDVQPGSRAITFTSDIGIGAPGDFSGALKSGVGPFLYAADAPGGNPLPFHQVPGGAPGSFFLSDAATLVFVGGSPFNTNFFRICGPPGSGFDGGATTPCLQQDQFTLMGKVHPGAIGSPLGIDAATYTRDSTGAAHVDVFSTATAGPGAPAPVLSLGDAAGSSIPSVLMNGPLTPFGQYYGQSIPFNPAILPAEVIVTNSADNPPSSVVRNLVDVVTITQALYNPADGSISITATSSDKAVPPQLFAIGLPGSTTGSDELLTPVSGDPAGKSLIGFTVGPVPPATVTVQSSAGGIHSELVKTVAGPPFPPGAPVAVNDSVTTVAGTTPLTIAVLANDSGLAPTPLVVSIITNPAQGTAVVDASNQIVYTQTNAAFVGDDSLTYTVTPSGGAGLESNVATVTVTTTPPSGGVAVPIPLPDGPFSVQANATLQLTVSSLLANDLPNGGVINPASFAITTVTGGAANLGTDLNGNPVVIFLAGPQAGNFGFGYTVANFGGAASAVANVGIRVLPTDLLTITAARFRVGNRRWDISGTSTVPGPGNTVTLSLVHNGGVTATIGTAQVDALGAWSFRSQNSTVFAGTGDQVLAQSTAGGSATLTVNVTR